jgi:hypothetical protein
VRATETLALPPQYLIRLVATQDDLVARLRTRRFDPITGVELLLEDVELPPPPPAAEGAEEEEEEEDQAGGDDGDDEDEDKPLVEEPPKPFAAAPVPLITRAAYNAGITRPDDVDVMSTFEGGREKPTPSTDASAQYADRFIGPFRLDLDDTRPIQELVTDLENALSLCDVPSVRNKPTMSITVLVCCLCFVCLKLKSQSDLFCAFSLSVCTPSYAESSRSARTPLPPHSHVGTLSKGARAYHASVCTPSHSEISHTARTMHPRVESPSIGA